VYVANSGSNTITGYSEDWHGRLTLLNADGVTATTDAAPVDLVASTAAAPAASVAVATAPAAAEPARATGSLRALMEGR